MTKEGIVAKADNNIITVLIKTHNACDACRAECGGHCDKAKLEAIQVKNTLEAEKGDKVIIYSETKRIMLYAFCVFVLPIVLTVACVLYLSSLTTSPLLLFLAGVFVFVSVFAVLHIIFKNKRDEDVFILKEVIKNEND